MHWVRPSLVVGVRFVEWTPEGRPRQPVSLGSREDKPPEEVVVEAPQVRFAPSPAAGALATLVDRLRALKDAHKNGWVDLSPFILPVLRDRPLVVKRFPDGVDRQALYQQRVLQPPPAGVRAERLPEGTDPIVEQEGVADPERFVGGGLQRAPSRSAR